MADLVLYFNRDVKPVFLSPLHSAFPTTTQAFEDWSGQAVRMILKLKII